MHSCKCELNFGKYKIHHENKLIFWFFLGGGTNQTSFSLLWNEVPVKEKSRPFPLHADCSWVVRALDGSFGCKLYNRAKKSPWWLSCGREVKLTEGLCGLQSDRTESVHCVPLPGPPHLAAGHPPAVRGGGRSGLSGAAISAAMARSPSQLRCLKTFIVHSSEEVDYCSGDSKGKAYTSLSFPSQRGDHPHFIFIAYVVNPLGRTCGAGRWHVGELVSSGVTKQVMDKRWEYGSVGGREVSGGAPSFFCAARGWGERVVLTLTVILPPQECLGILGKVPLSVALTISADLLL